MNQAMKYETCCRCREDLWITIAIWIDEFATYQPVSTIYILFALLVTLCNEPFLCKNEPFFFINSFSFTPTPLSYDSKNTLAKKIFSAK